MEIITLVVDLVSITVLDGRVKQSRLGYSGGGLEVWLSGAIPVSRRDAVHYHAMQQALLRHIPLTQFKRHGAL